MSATSRPRDFTRALRSDDQSPKAASVQFYFNSNGPVRFYLYIGLLIGESGTDFACRAYRRVCMCSAGRNSAACALRLCQLRAQPPPASANTNRTFWKNNTRPNCLRFAFSPLGPRDGGAPDSVSFANVSWDEAVQRNDRCCGLGHGRLGGVFRAAPSVALPSPRRAAVCRMDSRVRPAGQLLWESSPRATLEPAACDGPLRCAAAWSAAASCGHAQQHRRGARGAARRPPPRTRAAARRARVGALGSSSTPDAAALSRAPLLLRPRRQPSASYTQHVPAAAPGRPRCAAAAAAAPQPNEPSRAGR